jgi:hypothetical protein
MGARWLVGLLGLNFFLDTIFSRCQTLLEYITRAAKCRCYSTERAQRMQIGQGCQEDRLGIDYVQLQATYIRYVMSISNDVSRYVIYQ